MEAKPWDDSSPVQDGDRLYRYITTSVFTVLEPDPQIDAPPGYDEVLVIDGEKVSAICTAHIHGNSFSVYWAIANADCMVQRMASETTARRLFPNLGDYKFAGVMK